MPFAQNNSLNSDIYSLNSPTFWLFSGLCENIRDIYSGVRLLDPTVYAHFI